MVSFNFLGPITFCVANAVVSTEYRASLENRLYEAGVRLMRVERLGFGAGLVVGAAGRSSCGGSSS